MTRMQAMVEWNNPKESEKPGVRELSQEEIDEGLARMKELAQKGPPIGVD